MVCVCACVCVCVCVCEAVDAVKMAGLRWMGRMAGKLHV